MKTYYVEVYISKAQVKLYESLQAWDRKHKSLGYIGSVPVAFIDITLETLKSPLQIIEGLALAIINLLGGLFHEECTVKGSLKSMDKALTFTGHTPVAIVLAPFKFAHQAVSNVYDPKHATPYNNCAGSIVNQHTTLQRASLRDDEAITTAVF